MHQIEASLTSESILVMLDTIEKTPCPLPYVVKHVISHSSGFKFWLKDVWPAMASF